MPLHKNSKILNDTLSKGMEYLNEKKLKIFSLKLQMVFKFFSIFF